MTNTIKTFADFDVDPRLSQALAKIGITTPFPIQELTLPLALSGADLIGQARTGTGKTLAFGLPLLQNVDTASSATQALVIVPTRELCLQVHDDLKAAGSEKGATIVAAYGGRAIDPQSEAIAGGAEVVVGTPGRLLDLVRRGLLDLSTVSTLVLDEADEMLDMGFLPDVEQLIEACADKRQTLLFSATMPSEVVGLARRYMDKPTFMRADVEESRVAPETTQYFFAVHRMDKPALVARILATPERGRCVIFTRTKRMADMLVKDLREAGLNAAAIHSDLRQEAREKTLARFRAGKIDVMCATEVAARGLDIDEVTHVINYDCPDDEKMYLHRIGRTGRAGADGVAVSLAIWSELARLDMIKKALDISEPTHEVFSTSDILDELFPLDGDGQKAPADTDTGQDKRASGRRAKSSDSGNRRRRTADSGPQDRQEKEAKEPPTHRRVRRRTHASSSDAAAPSGPATSSADVSDASKAPAEDSSQPVVRKRVRRRSAPSEVPARTRSGRKSTEDSVSTSGTDTDPVTATAATTDSSDTSTAASDTARAPASKSSDGRGSRDTRGGRSSGSGGGRRGGRGRRGGNRNRQDGGGRGPQPSGHQRDRQEHEGAHVPADAATARGNGKPGLRRPLKIQHLP